MENNDEKLLANAKHNLRVAKEQLEKYKDNENISEETKKIFQLNYQNAQVNLKNIVEMNKKMAAAALDDLHSASAALDDAEKAASNGNDKNIRKNSDDTNVVLPGGSSVNDITIHFPNSSELQSAINYSNSRQEKGNTASNAKIEFAEPASDEENNKKVAPAKKMSTREALREAAKQTFVGGGAKKSAKKSANKKTTSNDELGMTREEYRKRHNK